MPPSVQPACMHGMVAVGGQSCSTLSNTLSATVSGPANMLWHGQLFSVSLTPPCSMCVCMCVYVCVCVCVCACVVFLADTTCVHLPQIMSNFFHKGIKKKDAEGTLATVRRLHAQPLPIFTARRGHSTCCMLFALHAVCCCCQLLSTACRDVLFNR